MLGAYNLYLHSQRFALHADWCALGDWNRLARDRRCRNVDGGVGIGFWVWDEWNNLNVPHLDRDRRHRFGRFDTEQILIAAASGFYLRRVSR